MIWLITFLLAIPAGVLADNIDKILEQAAKKIIIFNAKRVSSTAESTRLRKVWIKKLEAMPGSMLKLASACLIVIREPVPLPMVMRRSLFEVVVLPMSRPRLLLMMAIASSVALSEAVILGLAQSVAHSGLLLPPAWSSYFYLALGLGAVVAFFLEMRRPGGTASLSHRAAASLLLLAFAAIVFALSLNEWISLSAASISGAAAMVCIVSALKVTFRGSGPGNRVQLAFLWLLAFGISQAVGVIAVGWLLNAFGLRLGAIVPVTPAVCIGELELFLSRPYKMVLKRAMARAVLKNPNAAGQVISGSDHQLTVGQAADGITGDAACGLGPGGAAGVELNSPRSSS